MFKSFLENRIRLEVFLKKKQLWDCVFLAVFLLHIFSLINLSTAYRKAAKNPFDIYYTLTFSKEGSFNRNTLRTLAPTLKTTKISAVFDSLSETDIHVAKVKMRVGPLQQLESISLESKNFELLFLQSINDNEWKVEKKKIEIAKTPKSFQGSVDDSLWSSAEAAGVPDELIESLSEIFSWQIDFAHDVNSGAKWRFIVEEKRVDNTHFSWGDIVAAEIDLGKEKYQAFLHVDKKGRKNYFDAKGERLKRTFLRTPIKYAHITSKFKLKRFHPIIKKYRPHYGVDYAAKRGTPVRVVGDGTVISIGNFGSAGKMLKIEHSKRYSTAYMHLKNFPEGVVLGAKVTQGQVIGWVGNSGLSTGPHLHFEFYRNGRYYNPLSQRLYPKLGGVPVKERKSYLETVQKKAKALPKWHDLYAMR